MKKLEKIAGILTVVAIVLKFASMPGAGMLISTSLGALACVYLIFGFAIFNNLEDTDIHNKEAYKDISKTRFIGSVLAGWGLSIVCIGALFELMHWPGKSIILPAGLIVTLAVAVFSSIYRSQSDFFKTIFPRVAIVGGAGLILYIKSNFLNLPY